MSFALTTAAMRGRTKTVTRRLYPSWKNLQPTTVLLAVEKSQGLKKGDKVRPIGTIRVIGVRVEKLSVLLDQSCAEARAHAKRDVAAEGFAHLTPAQFVEMFCESHRCEPSALVTRIEFEHLGGGS